MCFIGCRGTHIPLYSLLILQKNSVVMHQVNLTFLISGCPKPKKKAPFGAFCFSEHLSRKTAVDAQAGAGDIARLRTGEVSDKAGDLLIFTVTANGHHGF